MGSASLVLLVRAARTYTVDVRSDGAREEEGQKRSGMRDRDDLMLAHVLPSAFVLFCRIYLFYYIVRYAMTWFNFGLQLSLSASKLLDRDIISKSDPMAVIYAKKRDGSLEELGRTEVIMNCLDPAWIEKINVAYQFEIVQPLIFHVYDVDTSYHNLPVKVWYGFCLQDSSIVINLQFS
ncbi:hypothetical protein RHGRI_014622 [Rhododendron griersonianum]|uniref:C2 domain-containing protein n=1 Tax=Rhododendron griersonianum TaxID=479676 RepID=A0AAV6KA45_9ERIC|nr:hypothetical protein RHGRI_014622 [Rhododendron griersonianum]